MSNNAIDLLTETKELEKAHQRWVDIQANGCSDPFWSDGVNMNLLRNHMIWHRNRIQTIVEGSNSEPTLFPAEYPDIWYKELPPKVSDHYMARADELRSHARAQLALYRADPNFQYLFTQAEDLYAAGQTRETKAADLPYYPVIALKYCSKAVEDDDLIAMRRIFRTPYEQKAADWKQYAHQIRTYLSSEHTIASKVAEDSEHTEEEDFRPAETPEASAICEATEPDITALRTEKKPLDDLLKSAAGRAGKSHGQVRSGANHEQLQLF